MSFSEGYKPQVIAGLYENMVKFTNESFGQLCDYNNSAINVGGISVGHIHAANYPDRLNLMYDATPPLVDDQHRPAHHSISSEQVPNEHHRSLNLPAFNQKPLGQKLADLFYTLKHPPAGEKLSAENVREGKFGFPLRVPYGSYRKGNPLHDYVEKKYGESRLEHYPRQNPTSTEVNIKDGYFLTPEEICQLLYKIHGAKSPRRIEDLASSLGITLGEEKALSA